jgi:hypothetical protein
MSDLDHGRWRDKYAAVRADHAARLKDEYIGDRYSTYSRLLHDFLNLSLRESARLEEDESRARVRAYDAFELASDLRSAVNRDANESKPDAQASEKEKQEWRSEQGRLWSHRDPEPALYPDYGKEIARVDTAGIGDIAARYMQRPWLQHGLFEWMMLDALLYAEIVEFAFTWKSRAPWSEGYGWMSAINHKGDLRAMRKSAMRKRLVWRLFDWTLGFVAPAIGRGWCGLARPSTCDRRPRYRAQSCNLDTQSGIGLPAVTAPGPRRTAPIISVVSSPRRGVLLECRLAAT